MYVSQLRIVRGRPRRNPLFKLMITGLVAAITAACGGGSGSGGNTSRGENTSPVLQLDDGQVIDTSGAVFTIPASDDSGIASVVANLLRQGVLQECEFEGVPVADSLIEACLADQPACAVDFFPGLNGIDVFPPPLYAPVGVEYQLALVDRDGSESDPVNTVLCLNVGPNMAPEPAVDTFQLIYPNILQIGGVVFDQRCDKQGNLNGVLANDDDDEHITNSCLSAELVDLPQFASNAGGFAASFGEDGSFRYEAFGDLPPADASGRNVDSFTYRVSDGVNPPSAPVRVEIVFSGENAAPVATADTFTVAEDTSGNILRVLDNDSDPDALPLSIRSINNGPGNGIANIRNGVLIEYQPNPDFSGVDQFSYTTVDSGGLTATAQVTVQVAAVNDAPVAVNDSVSTPENTPVEVFVLQNDSDPEGDSVSILQIAAPANGVAVDNGNGAILFTPAANFSGADPFEYTITDGNGASATATVVMTVDFVNVAPVANAGPDQTVEATSASGALISLDASASSDGDDDPLTFTWTGAFGEANGPSVELTLPLGTSNVTLDVDDGTVSAQDTVSVAVVDTTPPEVVAPATVNASSTGTVSIGTATATDIVDGALTAVADNTGPFPVGATTVTWSATDSAGNTGTDTQVIIIADSGAPSVVPPADISVEATGATTAVPIGTASATDAVDGALTATANNSGPFPVGSTTVIWTATDSAGNSGSATQTITVTDSTPPTVDAPADVSAPSTGTTTAVGLGTASATDLVDGTVAVTADNTGPYPVGVTVVTWTATDDAGNTGSATQTVTITDGGAPTVTPPANINAEATGTTTAVAIGSATATDAVDGAVTATANNTGPFPLGITTITWSATDGAGNTGTATQTITIVDTTAPAVVAPAAVTVPSSGATTAVTIGTATATDVVDGAVSAVADNTGPFPVGTTTVTWSATDAAGNTGTATQLITVTDNGAPSVVAPADVSAEATGPTTPVSIGSATATDTVDGSLPTTASTSGPFPVGETIVTWSATDSAGNSATATQTVTITDTTAPTVVAPDDVSVPATETVTLGSATATDLVDGALVATPSTTGPFPVGTTTVTWTATDSANNTGTATQTVTVTDDSAPVVTAPADITAEATGPTTAVTLGSASAEDATDGALTATASTTGPFPVGITTVTWSATDSANNTGSADQTVTITDTTAPTVVAPDDVSVTASETVTLGSATATDLVDGTLVATPSTTGPFPIGVTPVTWTATDNAGNEGTATQLITVTEDPDTAAPVVTAPPNLEVEATGATTSVPLGTATVTDDVDNGLVAQPSLTGPFLVGITTVTWSATDGAGNTGSADQTVTITDTTAPTVVAPDDVSVAASETVTLGSATATDLVDGTLVATPSTTGPFPIGVTPVTWTATDNAGNEGTATQLITVTEDPDTAAPVVTAPPNLEVEATGATTSVPLGTATVSDDVDTGLVAQPSLTGPFPVGVNTVTWSATDGAGNTGSADQTVTITDTTAPTVDAPADVTVTSAGASVVVALGTASATDLVDGALVPTSDAPAEFPIGETIVTWSVADSAGNVGTATQTVTVNIDAPPVVTAPPPLAVEAAGPTTDVILGTATAIDDVDGPLTPTTDVTGPFPVGITTVTWSATDSANNTGSADQTVTITDTTAPTVDAPADVTMTSAGASVVVVLGTASATDLVDGVLVPISDAPSEFPIGETIVTWSVADSAGNVGTATQTVTVNLDAPPVAASDAPNEFPLGETIVTWTAGIEGTATQLIEAGLAAPISS